VNFLENFFNRNKNSPRQVAKDRLSLVLMHDRADIPAPMMEQLRREILAVVSRYMDIDESQLDVAVEREGNAVALVANIPIRRVREGG
jgi:cell division topological specificity factor